VSTIGLLAAKGSPGVTTLATAMVLARSSSGAALIEADASGGDLALLHAVSQSPGLAELAARAQRGGDSDKILTAYLRPLIAGGLPTLLAPVDAGAARAALDVLGRHPRTFLEPSAERTLVLDFGRAEHGSLPTSLLAVCDALLLVSRADLTCLAHAQALVHQLAQTHRPTGFVLIDTGPYPAAEAVEALGLPCAGTVPFAPKHAAWLRDPLYVDTAASSNLVQAAGQILDTVTAHVAPQEVLVS
jgi:MinD-like ATPase involved in chromosome partitioning or flagellar assembly